MNKSIDPATLRITDMRFADITDAPKRCTLIKIYTNQGIVLEPLLKALTELADICPDAQEPSYRREPL